MKRSTRFGFPFLGALTYTRGLANGQKTICAFRPEDAMGLITFSLALAVVIKQVQISGMKAEDVIATYERVGSVWAKTRNRSLMEKAWLDRMLAAAPRHAGAVRVLELGCGSGQPIGTYLAERGAELTGVEPTSTLSALYARNLPKATLITADMRGLKLDQKFDAILAWNSFFHLSADDQRAMIATFAAHAAPRAALMFTAGHMAGEAIGEVGGAPIYHASLDPEEYRDLLAQNGFQVLRYTPEDPHCGQHTIWLAQFKP
jgi:SAM-dependent methyltransferase